MLHFHLLIDDLSLHLLEQVNEVHLILAYLSMPMKEATN
jgi:hypothetical protein